MGQNKPQRRRQRADEDEGQVRTCEARRGGKGAQASYPGAREGHLLRQKKRANVSTSEKLKLETSREKARFVSLLSAPFSNVLASYDEAKEEENLRKLAASLAAKAAGTPAAFLAPVAHKSNLIGAVLGATTAYTPSK